MLGLPQIGQDPNLVRSFFAAAAVLVLWAAALFVSSHSLKRKFKFHVHLCLYHKFGLQYINTLAVRRKKGFLSFGVPATALRLDWKKGKR